MTSGRLTSEARNDSDQPGELLCRRLAGASLSRAADLSKWAPLWTKLPHLPQTSAAQRRRKRRPL